MPDTLHPENSNLIERYAAASHELTTSSTFTEMADAIVRHMPLDDGEFITINYVVHDTDNQLCRIDRLAWVYPNQIYEGTTSLEIPLPGQGYPTVPDAEDFNKPLIIEQVQGNDRLNSTFRNWLAAYNIISFANFPIRFSGRVIGVLGVKCRTMPVHLSDEACTAYQLLANQLGALIQVNSLSKEVSFRQELIERQTRAFAELTANMNYEQMAGTVARHMLPKRGQFLGISQFLYDSKGQIEGWRVLTTANRERVYNWSDTPIMPWPVVASTLQEATLTGKPFIMPDINNAKPEETSPQLHDLLNAIHVESYVCIPMMVNNAPAAALIMMSRTPYGFTSDEIKTFSNLGDQMGTLIHSRSLLNQTTESLNMVQAQFETSNTIYRSTHPAEILEALNNLIGNSYQRGQIALVEPESDPPLLRIVAEIRDGKPYFLEELVPMDVYPAYQKFKSMQTLDIADVSTDTNLNDIERAKLKSEQIGSMLIIPMVVKTNLVGVVAFINRITTAASPTTTRSLRGMVDLAAVVVENRSLLQITGQSLEETQRLYEINRAILGAQDTQDVLRVIRELLTPNATVISELSVIYDETQQIQDLTVNYLNLPGSEQAIQMSIGEQIGSAGLQRLQSYWNTHNEIVTLVDDLETSDRAYPISDYIQQSGARSFVNILVRRGKYIQQVINMSFAEPRQFAANERRLFSALSDQIGIVMQNHHLLRDAQLGTIEMSKRVGQLQGINLVSTRILRATDEAAMVNETSEALVKLLGIDHCGITLVDANDPDYLVVAGEYPQQGVVNVRLPLRNNPLWDALQKQNFQPLYMSSREDQLIESETRQVLTNMGVYSIGIVPIVAGNRIIGGVGLDMLSAEKKITPEMLELAQILVVPLNIGLQNLRLLGNVQRSANQLSEQVDTLRSLQQIEAHLSSAQDEPTLLAQAVRDLGELLKAEHCSIALLDPSQSYATVVSEYPGQGAIGIQFTVSGNPLYGYLNERNYNPVIINDIDHDPILDEVNRTYLKSVGTKSMVIIPLVVHDRAIGSIGIDQYASTKHMSPETIDLALTVSSQIALALQNRRLVSEAERRAAQLQRIAAFSQNAQSSLEIRHTLDIMMNEASQMLPQNQMSISLYDKADQQLKVVAQRTDDDLRVATTDGDIIPITGHMQTVWEKAEPLFIPDLRAVTPDMDVGITLRSWLLVPVIGRGNVIGIVSVGSEKPFAYSETDISLFSQLVTQFGVVLENIDTYRHSQQTARNESLVNDISAQLQRQLDIQGMLNVTAAELGKAIGARRARIRLATNVPESDSQTSAE